MTILKLKATLIPSSKILIFTKKLKMRSRWDLQGSNSWEQVVSANMISNDLGVSLKKYLDTSTASTKSTIAKRRPISAVQPNITRIQRRGRSAQKQTHNTSMYVDFYYSSGTLVKTRIMTVCYMAQNQDSPSSRSRSVGQRYGHRHREFYWNWIVFEAPTANNINWIIFP